MDIPRIFNITESAHRIHNPITPGKLATLGAALRLESGVRVLDLGSGSGEMLCTWARDHGVIGTGIDSCYPSFSRLSATLATMSLKWFWLTRTAGTDTRRPNGLPCADGLQPIPTTSSREMFEPN
jgi:hypothetical protein